MDRTNGSELPPSSKDDDSRLHPHCRPSRGERDNQVRRVARVLDIIQEIAREPGRWNRRRLAERYEIGERMITKDLEMIRLRLGLELECDRQGYRFTHLPRLPQAAYSFEEALALLLAARSAQAIPGANSADLASAVSRLESLFPSEFAPVLREADRLPQRAERAHRQEMLALLHRAWLERTQVRIAYCTGSRAGETSERVVEPFHILPYGRSWQMIAFDQMRREIRQFKVDRVQSAELLTQRYRIPPDFDVERYLGRGWGMMRGMAGEPEWVSLLFEPEAGRWVAEESWHPSQRSETLPDGRVRIEFDCGITPEMVSWLLHYGARVWVEEPVWLRERVRAEHARAAEDSR